MILYGNSRNALSILKRIKIMMSGTNRGLHDSKYVVEIFNCFMVDALRLN